MKKAISLSITLLLFAVFTFAQGRVEAESKSTDNSLLYIALGVAVVGAGGAYFYSQRRKK